MRADIYIYIYVLIPTRCGHVIVMLCASVLKGPEQQTHPFLDWGATSVSPLRRALALGIGRGTQKFDRIRTQRKSKFTIGILLVWRK